MDLIDQFIARYRKEFDFYDQAARLAAQLIERDLQSAGIRAIVTFRAKSITRLEEKVRQRAEERAYKSVDDIFKDIVVEVPSVAEIEEATSALNLIIEQIIQERQ